jgi:hypothetical protein
MKLTFSPQRRDDTLALIKANDTLIINGEVLDFSPLPEGATLPSSAVGNDWIIGDITRKDGQIELTLILPHGPDASEAARFPVPLILTENGAVELPV